MKKAVILIGVGEMGGVFARGILKSGYSIHPVTRGMDLNEVKNDIADPQAVVVGVGEKDIDSMLASLPDEWKDKLVLLQNELLPRDWEKHDIKDPTVISVWFEKKQPSDFKVIIPSPVYGPQAQFIADALGTLDIACKVLKSKDELLYELILKNVYILTTNISGLVVGGNVGELWSQHQDLAREVANNVMDIQFMLAGKELGRQELIEGMAEAFQGDLEHKCMGRSAPVRLERALTQAKDAGIIVKKLEEISQSQKV